MLDDAGQPVEAAAIMSLLPAALRLALDADALTANWRALDRLSGTARAGAAIKADAYGLGAARVAPILRAAGARDFFVAHWREAQALLGILPAAEIAVLHGPLGIEDADFARATGIRPVINSPAQARRWIEAGGGRCDLMVDTGMNRLGVALGDLDDPAVRALDVDVLHSHLACADEISPHNAAQHERWRKALATVPHRRASLANSAGIMLGDAFHGDLTRPGLALYGGVPCAALAGQVRQVARPQAALLQVRNIAAGESAGYGATFTATKAARIGTMALGYADGYLRCWSSAGSMHGAGARLPVLGRVSMDLTIVDLSGAPDLREGDWLEADYALPAAAHASGLSQYELLTVLGSRFTRL